MKNIIIENRIKILVKGNKYTMSDNRNIYTKLIKIAFLIFFVGGLIFDLLNQASYIVENYPGQSVFGLLNIAGALGKSISVFIAGLILFFIGYGLYSLLKKAIHDNMVHKSLAVLFLFVVLVFYSSGMYAMFSSNNYSSKQLIGGLLFPPYAVYIGIDYLVEEKGLL